MPIEIDYPGVGIIEFPEGTSEDEIRSTLESLRPQGDEAAPISDPSEPSEPSEPEAQTPFGYTIPQSVLEQSQRVQQEQEQMRAYTGGSPFSPGGPDSDLVRAMAFGTAEHMGIPESIGHGLHQVLKPIEAVATPIASVAGGAIAPFRMMLGQDPMTAFRSGAAEPGKTIFPEAEPQESERGAIAELRRAFAGLTTPGGIATLGYAPASKLVQGAFFTGAMASIPPAVQEFIEAETPVEKRGAAAKVGIGTGFAGLIGRGMTREARIQARRQQLMDAIGGEAKRQGNEFAQLQARIKELEKDPDTGVNEAKQDELMTLRAMREQQDASGFLSDEQRESIGLASFDPENLELEVAVVEGNNPIQQARRLRGQAFGIDFRTGKIEIYADEFKKWWDQTKPELRQRALERRLNEEQWHQRVWEAMGNEGAAEFWNLLTPVEQALFARYYTGRWRIEETRPGQFRGMEASDLGHEAMRIILQSAQRGGTSETAELPLNLESLKLRTIEHALNAIGWARRIAGTKASSAQRAMLLEVENNLLAARAVVAQKEEEAPEAAVTEAEAPVAEPVAPVTEPKLTVAAPSAPRPSIPVEEPAAPLNEYQQRAQNAAKRRARVLEMGEDDMLLAKWEVEERGIPEIVEEYGVSTEIAADMLAKSQEFYNPTGLPPSPGLGPGGIRRVKRELPKLGVKWDVNDPKSLDKLTLGNLYALLDKENRFINFEMDRLSGFGEESPILQRFYDNRKAYSDAIKRKIGDKPPDVGPAGVRRLSYKEWQKKAEAANDKLILTELEYGPPGTLTRLSYDELPRDVQDAWRELQVILDEYPDYVDLDIQPREGEPRISPGLGPAGLRKPRRPDYFKNPETSHDVRDVIQAGFDYAKYLHEQRKPGAEIAEEIAWLTDYMDEQAIALESAIMAKTKSIEEAESNPETKQYINFIKWMAGRKQEITDWYEGLDQQSFPAGLRKPRGKREQERAELREKLRQMKEKASAGEMAPATEVGGIMYEPVTPAKAKQAVDDFFTGETHYAQAEVTGRPVETKTGELKEKIEGPSFEKLAIALKKQFGPMSSEAVRDLMFEHAGEALMNAPKERIIDLLKGMKLVKRVVGGGRPGEKRLGVMADPSQPVGQFHLFGDEREPLIMTKLKSALLRARRAKGAEATYQALAEEARQIYRSLRAYEKPQGQSTGPIWDVDERGRLIGRGREPLPMALQKQFAAKAGRLRNLRKQIDEILETKVKPVKPGQREPVEAVPPSAFEPGPPQRTHLETGHNLRLKSISVILHELFKQAEQTRKPLGRKELTADDLGSPMSARESVFARVSGDELKNPDELGEKLTTDARSKSYPGHKRGQVPFSITKRLVVVVDNKTGSVHMLDIYKDGRRGPVVMATAGGEAHIPLATLLKTHTPIYSVLLDEPVQNFRQRWKDVPTFQREFGRDAMERAQAAHYEAFPGEGIGFGPSGATTGQRAIPGEFEGGEGVVESLQQLTPAELKARGLATSGAMRIGGKPGVTTDVRHILTDHEARGTWDYFFGEEQVLESPDAVLGVIERLRGEIAEKRETAAATELPWVPISGLLKMMRAAMKADPELTEGQALESVGRWIYETNKRSDTRSQFVERTLANYGGMAPEPGAATPETAALAASERAGEAAITEQSLAKARAVETPPLEREQTVAPGALPGPGRGAEAADIRAAQSFEQAFDEAAARAVREPRPPTGPRPELPGATEVIHMQALKERVDDSHFERAIKRQADILKEVEKEIEAEFPKKPGETNAEWYKRIQDLHSEEIQDIVGKAATEAETLGRYKQVEQEAAGKMAQQQAELGDGIGPAGIIRYALPAAKGFDDLVGHTVGRSIRIGSEWMVDRLRRVMPPGAYITRKALNEANHIISQSQLYSGTMFKNFGDEMLRESGKNNAGTRWMNDVTPVGQPFTAAISNAKAAIEGNLRPPPEAAAITYLGQQANYYIGEFLMKAIRGFIANGGMHNNWTAFGYDVIRDGPTGRYWNPIKEGMYAANRGSITRTEINNLMMAYKKVLDDPAGDPAALFKINQDFAKKLPNAVTHIWVGPKNKALGHWEEIIHSDLFGYFNHGIRRAAMVRAFRESYPLAEGVQPGIPHFTKVVETMRSEMPGKYHNLINSLYRVLQGHPSENMFQTGSLFQLTPRLSQPAATAASYLGPIAQTFKTAWLSRQIFLQPAELFSGASSIFFGYDKTMLSSFMHLRGKEWIAALEMEGALDRILYNNSWNPASPVRSAFRIFNNQIRQKTGQNLFNEWQEAQGAGAAYITAARILGSHLIDANTGRPMVELTWSEKNLIPQTFRAMGFTRAEVAGMMAGDPKLLGQMVRKAASFLSGGHKHPAEQSRAMANRTFQKLFWFQQYPMARANQLVKLFQITSEHMRAGRKQEAANSALLLGKFMGGATLQGAMQTFILGVVAGGPAYYYLSRAEYDDEKFRFLFDSFRSAIAGPFQLITKGWEDSGMHGIANNVKRIAAPWNIATDLYDMLNGIGRYKDLEFSDRVGAYLQNQVPASKMVKWIAAGVGLSKDDPQLDAALTAYGKWQRKTFKMDVPGRGPVWDVDDRKNFRIQMRKAVDAMKNGDSEAYYEAKRAALKEKQVQTKGRMDKYGPSAAKDLKELLNDIDQSLLARRTLFNPQTRQPLTREETNELIDFIGYDAYRRLQSFDRMLEFEAGKFD